MSRIEIDKERCKACGLCIEVCNKHLLAFGKDMNAHGYHPVELRDGEKCTACSLCGIVCPEGGVTVYREAKLRPADAKS